MIIELTESYIPEKILFREEQIERLKKSFESFKNFASSQNFIIQGYSGSGKTCVITKLKNCFGNGDIIYSFASKWNTTHSILSSMFDLNYNTTGKLIDEIIKLLKTKPKMMIFDELNMLRDRREMEFFFKCLKDIYKETECPIIILTNLFGIDKYAAVHDWSNLGFQIISFPVYKKEELKEIFFERGKEIEKKHGIKIDEDKIETICNIVVDKGDSSARQVRRIINYCLVNQKWDSEIVLNLIEGLMEETYYKKILNMTPRERIFLEAVVRIFEKKHNAGGFEGIYYSELEKELSLSIPLISHYCRVFHEEYGLISIISDNKGRKGGGRKIIVFNKSYYERMILFNSVSGYKLENNVSNPVPM